ncbi:hypothetical protein MUP51_04360 [Candidatus Bathyarchaeota archaeon]|nr:hypothetical protein [Candidatus Bathyarchaeota archaeon]
MNEQQIREKINETLDKRRGDRAGGSGHLSQVSISDIKIDHTEETTIKGEKHLRVQYSYTIDILSEFTVAEDPDPTREPAPFDPYHYREKDELTIPI